MPVRNESLVNNRLRPIWRVLLYLTILAITYLVTSLGLQALLSAVGSRMNYGLSLVQYAGVVLLGTWICRRLLDRRDMATLGFALHRGWLLDIGTGLLLGFLLIGSIFAIEVGFNWIDVKGFVWDMRAFNPMLTFSFIIVEFIAVAVMEETMMRGYLLQTLEEGFGTPVAVLVTSALFGLSHLVNPSAQGWADYVIPFTLTLGGIMFAFAYLVHRSLWLPLALHFSWNLFEYDIFGLTGSPVQSASFLVTDITGPTIWVGLPNSAFGPEVGMLGVLAMLLGIGSLWLLRQGHIISVRQMQGAGVTGR